jgi:hypothetical protein
MRRWAATGAMLLLATGCSGVQGIAQSDDGWISLFDGRTLDGWRASENPATFRVENGVIVVHGPRAHLFYDGPVANHNFRNFEWKADVLTFPQANSGMYFHTEFQETGWPAKGYEVQVNNSHSDPRRTGSLYAIDDVNEMLVPDGEWFTQHVIVEGKRVRVLVNGRQVVDYTEPTAAQRPNDMAGRLLSSGTVALQGHDPNSQVHYRNIMIRPLPD